MAMLFSVIGNTQLLIDFLSAGPANTDTLYTDENTPINSVSTDSVIAAILIIGTLLLIRLLMKNKTVHQHQRFNAIRRKLTESEKLHEHIYNSLSFMIFTHTLDGHFIAVNPGLADHFKLGERNLAGTSIDEFIHPGFRKLLRQYLHDVRENKRSEGWVRVIKPNREVEILWYSNEIFQPHAGEPYVLASLQNHTDTFKARRETKRERKRLSSISKYSPDVLSILTSDGTIAYRNRSDFFDTKNIVGKNIDQFLTDDQKTQFHNILKQVSDSKDIIQTEQEFQGKSVITRLIPILDHNRVSEILAIDSDITESKRKEAELRKLSSIVEQTADAVVITDRQHQITWVNASFETITGYTLAEALGKSPGKLLQGKDTSSDTIAFMHNNMNEHKAFTCEILNYHKNGAAQWININCTPIMEGDRFEGYFAIQQNITHQKKILEQLREAKEEAEESNRLKTIFLGSLSHEVRTPLQGILGFAEILETPGIPMQKHQQYLDIIKRRTTDLQNIIDSLLDMASLESGEIKAFPVDVNLFELVESIFGAIHQDYSLDSSEAQLILQNNIAHEEVLRIDPLHLRQVIINLVRNGIKFTTQGSVTLSSESLPQAYLISVTDTGIGIPAEKLNQIFKPFRQAHEGLSRSRGGIGLGLSICQKMVELWGGTIQVHSEPGKGSTFSFTVPKPR